MSESEYEIDYEVEEFKINGDSFFLTTVEYLPIEILLKNRTLDKEISGQKLWCGSLGVINYILKNKSIIKEKNVLELGAGTGLLGMISRKFGASKVLLTDHDKISLKHMEEDIKRNSIDNCIPFEFDWFNPCYDKLKSILNITNDTQTNNILLAGDVVYKSNLLDSFFSVVKYLLVNLSFEYLILCHVPRADVSQEKIISFVKNKNLEINEIFREEWSSGDIFEFCPKEDLDRACLYKISLNSQL